MINRLTYWSLYDACLTRIAAYLEMRPASLHERVADYCARTGTDAHVGLREQRRIILHQLRNG